MRQSHFEHESIWTKDLGLYAYIHEAAVALHIVSYIANTPATSHSNSIYTA